MSSRRIGPFILIACAIIVNSVTEEIVDPADIKKLTTPTPSFQAYENWTDWESWEPSADIAQGHPRYRSGYDLDGLVGTQVPIAARYAWTRVMATKILIDFNEQYEVHVIEAGVLDERKWATGSKEKQEEFWKAYEYWTRREEKDATFNNNQGIVLILDLDGFALKNSASPAGSLVERISFEIFNFVSSYCNQCHFVPALQADMKMFSMIFRQNNAVKYGFVINGTEFMGLYRYFKLIVVTCKFSQSILGPSPSSTFPNHYGGTFCQGLRFTELEGRNGYQSC